jgi:hypothetical protein
MKWTKRKAVLVGVGLGLFLLVVLLPLGGAVARQAFIEPSGGPMDGEAEITAQIPWSEFLFSGWETQAQTDIHITTAPK